VENGKEKEMEKEKEKGEEKVTDKEREEEREKHTLIIASSSSWLKEVVHGMLHPG
jgi:hypothetical protein